MNRELESGREAERGSQSKGVVLFGSRSRGDWKPWGDYDLLVIAEFEEKYLDRISKLLDLLSDVSIPIEPHPYTLKEAMRMLERGNPTIVDALEEGEILYSTPELEDLIERYKEMKRKGLRRSRTSIILPSMDEH